MTEPGQILIGRDVTVCLWSHRTVWWCADIGTFCAAKTGMKLDKTLDCILTNLHVIIKESGSRALHKYCMIWKFIYAASLNYKYLLDLLALRPAHQLTLTWSLFTLSLGCIDTKITIYEHLLDLLALRPAHRMTLTWSSLTLSLGRRAALVSRAWRASPAALSFAVM